MSESNRNSVLELMNDDNNRFSVLKLENDVKDYMFYKEKFNEYDVKSRNKWNCFFKKRIMVKRYDYYEKYISKLAYLNNNYRKTKIYTSFHEDLEQPYNRREPVIATVVPCG
tara:strand:- start:1061 stop:1396 length:336 start_codon:yes stop_codon:yes gene_type:complete